ncbi:MAG: hypothetical protein Kow00107_09950 [Planctomycetota bacterium]
MTQDIREILSSRFRDIHFVQKPIGLVATVLEWQWREVAEFCHADERLAFDFLFNYTAVDRPPEDIEVYAQLFSYLHRHKLVLRVVLERDEPELKTLSSIWPAANWYEREMFDLFGIVFLGHPNLKRLFLPDYWKGHPLLKDYQDDRIVPLPEVLSE